MLADKLAGLGETRTMRYSLADEKIKDYRGAVSCDSTRSSPV